MRFLVSFSKRVAFANYFGKFQNLENKFGHTIDMFINWFYFFTGFPNLLFSQSLRALCITRFEVNSLTLSWRRPLYRNQSIDLLCKSMDWFLYDNGLRHERVNLFVPLFIVTSCIVVAVMPCMEWIPIKKNIDYAIFMGLRIFIYILDVDPPESICFILVEKFSRSWVLIRKLPLSKIWNKHGLHTLRGISVFRKYICWLESIT